MNTTCEATRLYVSRWNSDKITSAQDTTDFSEARQRLSLEVREAEESGFEVLFSSSIAELLQSVNCFLHQFERELPGRHFSSKRRGLT